jgi:hypothetical protein
MAKIASSILAEPTSASDSQAPCSSYDLGVIVKPLMNLGVPYESIEIRTSINEYSA